MLYSKAADFYYNLWQKWWWKHDIPLARSWIIFCKKRTRSNRKRLSTFSSYFYDKQTTFGTICIPNVQPANEQFGEKKSLHQHCWSWITLSKFVACHQKQVRFLESRVEKIAMDLALWCAGGTRGTVFHFFFRFDLCKFCKQAQFAAHLANGES